VERVPEEELMDSLENAQAYADVDFSEPNSKFVAHFAGKFPGFSGGGILDLGCGPGDIAIRLARRYPAARIAGLDGATAMVEIARKAVARDGLTDRVEVQRWHIGREANPLASRLFDAVVSNSLLHHMSDPLELWNAVRSCAAPGAAVLVMDLFRPPSQQEARNIVETYAGGDPEIFKTDFLNSLLASYRPAEVVDQLAAADLASLQVDVVSDRHLMVVGRVDGNR
jgi:cyclopropane fatty-acyl-phospholipid synthase-like methyltransferase